MLRGYLSALDAAFLHLETPEMPMHIGAMYRLKLPAGYKGDYYEDYKALIASRLHIAPVFTRKLENMPFDLANPVWIDDDDIDLDYHIRHTVLPRPGSIEQLEKLVGRLHSSLLDRSRPLWEFYIIEGLASGEVAFYSKVHHAALDGQAGMKLTQALLDITEEPRVVKPMASRPGRRGYQLGVGELLWAGLTHGLGQSLKLVQFMPNSVRALGGALLSRGDDGRLAIGRLVRDFRMGPRTHFNGSITNQRSFGSISLDLKRVKAIGKQLGATINDIVLALCSGALRRYLADYDNVPDKPLIAAVPVSMRAQGDETQNNQVLMAPVTLATDEKDPLKRLAAIKAASASTKSLMNGLKSNVVLDVPSLGTPWLMTGLISLLVRSRVVDAIPPVANVTISNVPGPQFPLYMARAEVLCMHPVSIPFHGVGINITVQSYNGHLDFGITACRRSVPDVKSLTNYLGDALDELEAIALAKAEAPPVKKPRPRPRLVRANERPADAAE